MLLFWTSINFLQRYRQIEYSKTLFVILNFLSKIRQTRISQFSRILHFLNFLSRFRLIEFSRIFRFYIFQGQFGRI